MDFSRLDLDGGARGQRRARKIFTSDEDAKLTEIMHAQKFTSWEKVAQDLPDRTARQCRDRWLNYLSPSIRKDPWSFDEDRLLVDKINEMGTHWSGIAKHFIGRSDNHIKNRWYSFLKSRVRFDQTGKYCLLEPDAECDEENRPMESAEMKIVAPGPTSMPNEDFWDVHLLNLDNKESQQSLFSQKQELPEWSIDVFSIL